MYLKFGTVIYWIVRIWYFKDIIYANKIFFLSENNNLLFVQKFFLRNRLHKMNKRIVGDQCMYLEYLNLILWYIFYNDFEIYIL